MMHRLAVLILVSLLGIPNESDESPRTITRAALAAVEGDSAARVAARWQARLRRHPDDRAAALGLATLARNQYEYEDARQRYRALDADPPDIYAVYARLGLAVAADAQGLQAEADSQFRRALAGARAVRDRSAEGIALMNLAYLVATLRGVQDGMAYLDSASRVIPAAARDLEADVHRRRAVLLAVQSDAGASAEAASCTRMARSIGALRIEANCLQAAALDLRIRGLSDSSLVIFRQAEQLQRHARDHARLAETLLREADIFRAGGAFGEAKRVLTEALAEGRVSHNLLALASAHTGMGSLAMRLQDFATAGDELGRAITLFQQQGDPAGAMLARAFLPMLHAAAGDLAGAASEADSILAWYRRTGEVPNEFEMLRTRASIAMRAQHWALAAHTLDRAERLAVTHDMAGWRGALELDRGRLALYQGALPQAGRHLQVYLRGLDSSAHVSQHEARLRLAEVHARQGDLGRAERELAQADNALDRWRAALADRDLRTLAFQAMPTEDFEDHASAARVLALLAAGGEVDTAFALAERRRARELADQMAQADAFRHGDIRPGLAVRVRAQAAPATAAEVASALPDDSTALVEYVAGAEDAPSTVFVLTRAGAQARLLAPADSLGDAIERFVILLESGDEPGALARRLGAAVLDSALAALPRTVTRLIIIPDGRLHHLPFDALALPDGQPVVTRYAVSFAPSAAVALALWRRSVSEKPSTGPVAVLAFGDPAFAGEQTDSGNRDGGTFRAAFSMHAGLPRLEGSGDEADDVARFTTDAVVRLRADASEAFLKQTDLSRFGVLHFATHALVDEASLDRTALALAPGGGEDGFVTPAELADLRLDARLVVLSACRTAGGTLVTGEGVEGLTAPLLAAGARSVVATKWQVSDQKTVQMVEDLYAALSDGEPVGAALRSAKLAAIRRGAPTSEWAAFSVIGDPLVQVSLSHPARFSPIWSVLLLGGVVGVLIAVWMRRRGAR